ncbi:hypothetical protein [Enterococcus sp. AZ109]|uniref:hypothetical protein n=1 Tax=Enterococcus sp. AZ109 TaxID=2774634 RepID=UPI003F213B9D
MKKSKKWLLLLPIALCIGLVFYFQTIPQKKTIDKPIAEEIASPISTAHISFDDAVSQSDLIVKVEITGLNSEIDASDESEGSKFIYDASILEVFAGTKNANEAIKIMQDNLSHAPATESSLFAPGDTLILMLYQAQPEKEFPNTYPIYKEYLLSNVTTQAIDLNPGDSNFTDLGTPEDPGLNARMAELIKDRSIDAEVLSIISTEELEQAITQAIQGI